MSWKLTVFIFFITLVKTAISGDADQVLVNTPFNYSIAPRIINGYSAQLNEFRYYASIQLNGEHICGGAIIAKKTILTAAHCVAGSTIAELSVHTGSIHRKQGGYHTSVRRIKLHDEYMYNPQYDIAILELTFDPTVNWNVEAIALTDRDIVSNCKASVLGFGMDEKGYLSTYLKWSQAQVLSKQSCKDAVGWGYNTLVCLKPNNRQGICGGDFGGPAVYNGKLIGIANFILSGCADSLPDEYANVYFHLNWIRKNMVN